MIMRTFTLLTLFFLLSGAWADTTKIVILQTTDLHSHIRDKNSEEPYSWVRLASIIKKERLSGNSLLIDCGDTLQGQMTGTLSKGEAAVEMLNLLGYDAWVPGNHDFDFGIDILRKRCSEIKADKLAANLKCKKEIKTVPWKLYSVNRAKIAVIGMTYPEMDNYCWQGGGKEFEIENADEVIDRLMPEILSASPDMIILAIHDGYLPLKKQREPLIASIAKRHPEINLILGGHIHQDEPGRLIGRSVWYASAGKHAENLLKAEAEIDTANHSVISLKSKLLPVTHSTPEDPECAGTMSRWLKASSDTARRQIGETSEKIYPLREKTFTSPMNELACRSMAGSSGASIAFYGGMSAYSGFSGRIFEGNLFSAFPYEDSVGTLEVSPSELKSILSEQISKYNYKNFLAPWGFYAEINASGEIGAIRLPGGEIFNDENKRIKAAFSSYALASAGNRFPILKEIALRKETSPHDTKILVRDAVRNYIMKNSPLNITEEKWLKEKNEKRKPQHRGTAD